MKEKIISEIIREMLSSLNNEQLSKLKTTLEIYLYNVSIEAKQEADKEKEEVYGYDKALSYGIDSMQMQGAMVIFAANIKRILRLS